MTVLQTFFEPWFVFLAEDPVLRMLQLGMLLAGTIAVFLVFYTTRDILLRTNSFLYMVLCILLVAMLPVVGFFLYILIRPPRTIKEREFEEKILSFINDQSKKVAKKTVAKKKK